MSSLYDEIQKRLLSQKAAAPTAPGGAQAAAAATFQAATGKAAASGGVPKASNVGEQVATAATAAAGTQQQQRTALAAEQLATQANAQEAQTANAVEGLAADQRAFDANQAARGAASAIQRDTAATTSAAKLGASEAANLDRLTTNYQRALDDLASERGIASEDLFAQFRQGHQELAFRKDAAQLDQLAHQLALADKKYVAELQRVGQERRLGNALAFRAESLRLMLGDELADLMTKLNFQVDLNADQRAFDEQMAAMDADAAAAILATQVSTQNRQMIVEGLGTVAKAGATYYAKQKDPDEGQA